MRAHCGYRRWKWELQAIHASAIDQFETVLDKFLLYGQTTSSIVQSTPVPPRPLPLPEAVSPASPQVNHA